MKSMDKPNSYLPGPEPILEPPPLEAAVAAERALKQAQEKNNKAGKLVAGVAPEQAEVLLAWMVYKTRDSVLMGIRSFEMSAAYKKKFFSDPKELSGMCGLGRETIGFQAEILGLKALYHQIPKLSENYSTRHAFSVLLIPVARADGGVAEIPYLVDTTFRQFFDKEEKALWRHIYHGSCKLSEPPQDLKYDDVTYKEWGAELIERKNGKTVADQVLSCGYIELTPEVANLYVGSVQKDAEGRRIKFYDSELLSKLISAGDEPNRARERERFDSPWFDVRTPFMVAERKPLETMAAMQIDGPKLQVSKGAEHQGTTNGKRTLLDDPAIDF
jgi:hypothetical protein